MRDESASRALSLHFELYIIQRTIMGKSAMRAQIKSESDMWWNDSPDINAKPEFII